MPGLYTEADYENSVIELFRNELGYEYAYGPLNLLRLGGDAGDHPPTAFIDHRADGLVIGINQRLRIEVFPIGFADFLDGTQLHDVRCAPFMP